MLMTWKAVKTEAITRVRCSSLGMEEQERLELGRQMEENTLVLKYISLDPKQLRRGFVAISLHVVKHRIYLHVGLLSI